MACHQITRNLYPSRTHSQTQSKAGKTLTQVVLCGGMDTPTKIQEDGIDAVATGEVEIITNTYLTPHASEIYLIVNQ